MLTALDARSTFGLDVDTASYARARAALRAGKLPDPGTVRVEECINSFPEKVKVPQDKIFSVFCEGGPSPFGRDVDLLKITVKSRALRAGERRDAVLTFAVDTSGSMAHGDTISQVRSALKTLVRSLKPTDRVAVVAFSSSPFVLLPHTSVRDRERVLAAIDSLSPMGGTNVEAGLDLAYKVADESLEPRALNRIVLCSDGAANVGTRGPEKILESVKVYARRGVYLSAVGFGQKGYQDAMLQRLADEGNGNYSSGSSRKGAEEIFRKNLPSTLEVLAKNAKIQVTFDKSVIARYRLLGYEKRD
ncbi:MAG: DUF3520 domain-containing protein, partial [bacterium]|nr:DUF3520 domain-containing protein [bacterium]